MKTTAAALLVLFAIAGPISCEKEAHPSHSPPIVEAARSQIGKTVRYDGSYRNLAAPTS